MGKQKVQWCCKYTVLMVWGLSGSATSFPVCLSPEATTCENIVLKEDHKDLDLNSVEAI